MAGAWEKQETVLCGTLHTDNTTMAWAYGFRQLMIPGRAMAVAGMPFDHARNFLTMKCLEGGFSYLFFLDSDVIPPPDAIIRLMRHKKPVISGLYCRRSPPHGVPVMMKPVGNWITQLPPKGQLVEADVVGAGCLLIHRSVLEQMKPQNAAEGKHWWHWRVDCPPRENYPPLSEDFTWCVEIKRQLGIPILIDPEVKCRHIGLFAATYGEASPLEGMLVA